MNGSICGDQALLQMLAEGTLTGSDLHRAKAHVSGCLTCRRAVTEYKQVMWDLTHPEDVPIPPDLERSYYVLIQEWKKERDGRAATRYPSRSFIPAWAGYTVSWTRKLPAVGTVGALLGRTGRSVIRRALPRWLRHKGGERD